MLERGKYGIEYDPRQRQHESSRLAPVLVSVLVLAIGSLVWTMVARLRSSGHDNAAASAPAPEVATNSVKASSSPAVADSVPVGSGNMVKRPQKVRSLLMRLAEAEKRRDVEMAVATIETIRSLPGAPAADLDDALARRLGTLNSRRLFSGQCPQWVKEITVRRGDTAERLASENATTISAIACLNNGDVGKLVPGRKLLVMNHPRFNLVVRRRARTADLSLNGKFFRRYDLTEDVSAANGVYSVPANARDLWRSLGLSMKLSDATELETLLPPGAPVLISEM